MNKLFYILFFSLFISACSDDSPSSPPQSWGDMTFSVEARPPYFDRGMVEFLIVADRGHKRAQDLIVSIRVGEMGKWTQAIQDGQVGVYRRALGVNDASQDQLQVYVKHNGEENLFVYPLDIFATKNRKQ